MENYATILQKELIPAFGCTEPIALAYAAAKVTEVLGEVPEHLLVRASGNIIKNVKSVIVPGSGGERGIEISAALGAIAGDAAKKLEVLNGMDKQAVAKAKGKVAEGYVDVELVEGEANLYIEVKGTYGEDEAVVTLADSHTNIVYVEKNGKVLEKKVMEKGKEEVYDYSFDDIWDYAKTAPIEPVKDILDLQISYNSAIAEEGMAHAYGAEIGRILLEDRPDNLEREMIAYAAAGSDARMSGSEMPVVINSGSGNQGITVSVPLIVYARANGMEGEPLYRALMFANLIGLYLKQGIGRLSAYCGAVSAASAAMAGLAFLKGDSKEIAAMALTNSLAGNSGLICDGAKASCAMKIASSLHNALISYKQAQAGHSFHPGDGIVHTNVDETIATVGHIAKYGMKTTDVVILNEMIGNRDYMQGLE